jgi:hypothetical protein
MSTNTTYNAKFVAVADRVVLVAAVIASVVILLAGVYAHNGASASPVTPSPALHSIVIDSNSTGGAGSLSETVSGANGSLG